MHKALHGKKVHVWLISILISIIIGFLSPDIEACLPTIIGKLYSQTLLPYLWMFLTAAFIAEKKEQLFSSHPTLLVYILRHYHLGKIHPI